jgi:plasmid stabilization system protein ParE
MPFLVSLLPRAQRDLEAIYNYIQADSSSAAHRWFNGLADAIETLATNPEIHPRTPEHPELRHLLYGRKPHIYRIIYLADTVHLKVHILHIRHGARNSFNPETE